MLLSAVPRAQPPAPTTRRRPTRALTHHACTGENAKRQQPCVVYVCGCARVRVCVCVCERACFLRYRYDAGKKKKMKSLWIVQ